MDPRPAHPFTWSHSRCGRILQSSPLAAVAPHLFTTSDLTLRGAAAEDGWAEVAAAIGVASSCLMRPKQVHGVAAVIVRADVAQVVSATSSAPVDFLGGTRWADRDGGRPHADIIATDLSDVAVAVQVADCVPLLLADPVTGTVAAVHAGWRGTAARVAQAAVALLMRHFAVRPGNLRAAIGPSIGPCCYQVGADVHEAFRASGFEDHLLRAWFRADGGNGRYRLDVAKANADQLAASGLARETIATSGLCTACHPSLFPSYRRDGTGTGRLAGVIRGGRPDAPSGRRDSET